MKGTRGRSVNTEASVSEMKNRFRRRLATPASALMACCSDLIGILTPITPPEGAQFTALPGMWQRGCFAAVSVWEGTEGPGELPGTTTDHDFMCRGTQQTPQTRCSTDLEHLICEDNFLPSSGKQKQQRGSLINYWFKNLEG